MSEHMLLMCTLCQSVIYIYGPFSRFWNLIKQNQTIQWSIACNWLCRWLWMKLYQAVHRLKLQAGSTGASENNANVPVLVEVWQVLVQMVWGNARVHSRGSKYGGKHFLCKPRIVLVKWARQQNCPLISYKSGLLATARHLNPVDLFIFLLRPSLLEMCQFNSIYKCFNFSIKGSFIKLEMFQRLPYTVGGKLVRYNLINRPTSVATTLQPPNPPTPKKKKNGSRYLTHIFHGGE